MEISGILGILLIVAIFAGVVGLFIGMFRLRAKMIKELREANLAVDD